MRRAGVVVALAFILVGAAFATPAATIRPTSIAGAKLGLRASAYKQLFGTPVRKDVLRFPSKWARLIFTKKKVAVFFPPNGKAVEVATWNANDKTARRIGTCSSIRQLKTAYGTSLKQSDPNTIGKKVWAYTLGKLIFAAAGRVPSKHVTAVALYSGHLNVAGFLAMQPENSALRCG